VADASQLVHHWGYFAIFGFVVLGNMGFPFPEETILLLAGYLAWEGGLRLSLVLPVGILSAIIGDNIGYWLGHRYGQRLLDRFGLWIVGKPERLEAAREILHRHGARGVFAARFIPGVRFLAGPLAGAMGLPPGRFLLANVLGASLYVPIAVGLGYAVGYGLGDYLSRFERLAGQIEYYVILGAVLFTILLLLWRAWRWARPHRQPSES
jgi:membrane protein DedA with SNARE-associated domain